MLIPPLRPGSGRALASFFSAWCDAEHPAFVYPMMLCRSTRFLILCIAAGSLLPGNLPACAQSMIAPHPNAMVRRAVQIQIANDERTVAMRYRFTKITDHGTFVKDVIETRDGEVSRLVAINGKPPDPQRERQEEQRLHALLADPASQRRHHQHETEEQQRIDRLMRELPDAFLFRYAGEEPGMNGPILHYTFVPNPRFSPPDMESRMFEGMTGDLWFNQLNMRFVRLQAHLIHNVRWGLGLLATFEKGGRVSMENDEVLPGYWAITHMRLDVEGSALVFKTLSFHMTENQSDFTRLSPDTTWRQAVAMLEKDTRSSVAQR
jgi:hypothetical protein